MTATVNPAADADHASSAAQPPPSDPLNLDAWRELPAAQQPNWPDADVLHEVAQTLSQLPPLVVASEVDALTNRLAQVA
ncbi:MAG: 3-deoxy-7-phosphoheptulonate synthase, partial [Pseudonocardiales bacterium]|nr:3-deoxy-7-phosphoheptulonate synthase [Pseudonocardiales bacterium]